MLACKVLFADSDRLWYAGAGFDPILGRSRHEGFGEPDVPGELADTRARHRRGDGGLARRDRSAGLLDEELFLYAEDLEWSLRIREAGFAVVYVPEARVRHRVSAATGGAGSPTASYYETRNMLAVVERVPAAAARADGCAGAVSSWRPVSCSRRAGRRRRGRRCAGGATTAAGAWAAASLSHVANERSSFYRRVLEQLVEEGVFRRDMTVLVVAGGPADRDVFRSSSASST